MTPDVLQALKSCVGVLLPGADQNPDGSLEVALGAKGIVELELVASGEKWGRGPQKDIHSSLRLKSIRLPGTWCKRSTPWLGRMDIHRPSRDSSIWQSH